ncbi:MAG: hypothetical protein U0521_10915 [Anaerolineae bacterium]
MNYPAPRLIFWETTAGCNLRCIHCRRVTVADQLTPQDLTTDDAFHMIDEIAREGENLCSCCPGRAAVPPGYL